MAIRKQKRCPFCRCLFRPDPRSAKRQWACSQDECQKQRRLESQRRWRAKNPADGAGRRYRAAVARAREEGAVLPRRSSPRIPWDELRTDLAPEIFVALVVVVRSLLSSTRFSVDEFEDGFDDDLDKLILIALAGLAAEEIVFGEVDVEPGFLIDIQEAAGLASKSGSNDLNPLLDRAKDMLAEHRTALDALAEELLQQSELTNVEEFLQPLI